MEALAEEPVADGYRSNLRRMLVADRGHNGFFGRAVNTGRS